MDMHTKAELLPMADDHAQNPRNYGPPAAFNGHSRITGPCGDTMEFWVQARGNTVQNVSFTTDGCRHSKACGSIAACLAEGKTLEEAAIIEQQDILEALGGLPEEDEHCALLAANTLRAACESYVRNIVHGHQGDRPKAAKSCSTCSDESCSASKRKQGESDEDFAGRQKLEGRLCRIRHKVVVLSGKGGVGKSTVAVNLAVALMMDGWTVGLLDADIHGPSVPTMLGLEGQKTKSGDGEILPVEVGGLKVMSLGFFLSNPDDAVIWRGPMKMGALKQFLTDVAWGDLDYLIVDSPPGTGDEPLSICQLLGTVDGAVIVTTPQRVAEVDVRKSISFCRAMEVPVIGVVENMSGFVCPRCGEVTSVFRTGAGRRIAEDMGVPYLGSIPMDPNVAEASDAGQPFIHAFAASPTAKIMQEIIRPIEDLNQKVKEK
jgi:Mrp family chromosome partitioning ATPase